MRGRGTGGYFGIRGWVVGWREGRREGGMRCEGGGLVVMIGIVATVHYCVRGGVW